jgi:hypothetical protein
MKRIYLGIICCLAVFFFPQFLSASSTILPPSENVLADKSNSIQQFLLLTPKKYREITGEKMTLAQKLSLKFAQHKIKKQLKNGVAIDLPLINKKLINQEFSLGGFALGVLLSFVGVLIAYLIGDRRVIKWAWIGAGLCFAVILLILLI